MEQYTDHQKHGKMEERIAEMEKRLQYLEGKEAEREAHRQYWIDRANGKIKDTGGPQHPDVSVTTTKIVDAAITTARLSN